MFEITFSQADFQAMFREYNFLFHIGTIASYVLAILMITGAFFPGRPVNRYISLILCLLWLWNGLVFNILYFADLFPPAYFAGLLFILQGFLFFQLGFFRKRYTYSFHQDQSILTRTTAVVFILYSLVVYPILGNLAGHPYPDGPVFGLAPCPLTIFTFGFLLLIRREVRWFVFGIPLLWALMGIVPATKLGVIEDLGLIATGLIGTAMLLYNNYSKKSLPHQAE